MSSDSPSPVFADVPRLVEASEPHPRSGWFWPSAGLFALIMLVAGWASAQSQQLESLVRALSGLAMLGIISVLTLVTWLKVQGHREEAQKVAAVEELVQLRRWPEAAQLLERLLGRPMRTIGGRVQALIYLAALLTRYHRFDEAVQVQQYLLDHAHLDPASEHGLRLGRAMAMLRADHLFDADRAINELRRQAAADQRESGGLALIEIYRDVKTGHPAEAANMFEARLPVMRDQLGHRVSDGYALAAHAYDALGRGDEARRAWERATTLSPPAELVRRYPELSSLPGRYEAAAVPQGAMA